MAKIIHIIGTSGSGKDAVHEKINLALVTAGYEVRSVAEPGPLKKYAKAYRLRTDKNPWTEAALFSADRFITYSEEVYPYLKDPDVVITSVRGLLDSLVYQGMQGGVPIEAIQAMNSAVPTPDICLCLVVDGKVGHQRIHDRHARTGEPISPNETPEKIEQLAGYYRRLKEYFKDLQIIDTTAMNIEEVTQASLDYVLMALGRDLSNVRAVGFDLDGTLYRQTPEISNAIIEYICQRSSKVLQRKVEEVSHEFHEQFKRLNSASRSLAAIGIENGKAIVNEALETIDIASCLNEDPQLVYLMQRMSEQYSLFLITGSFLKTAEDKLQALGLHPSIFSEVITAELPYRREDTTAFQRISVGLGVKYNQIFFVGDREQVDVLPAIGLGIHTAIVNSKSKHAHFQLENIYQLQEILLLQHSDD